MFDPIILSRVTLLIAASYLSFGLLKITIRSFTLHKFFYLLAAVSLSVHTGFGIWIGDPGQLLPTELFSMVLEWIRITGIASLLTGLAVMVRMAKPKITQAPLVLSLLPLLLLTAHPFVIHTLVLKDILINMYITGAIIIGILMYGLKTYHHPVYVTVLLGIILAAGAFAIGSTELSQFNSIHVLYNILIATSSFVVKSGIERVELHELKLTSNT